jgi:hypothetical protein
LFADCCSHKKHECIRRTIQCTTISRNLILPTILDTCLIDKSRHLREWTMIFHWEAKNLGRHPNA